jgi:hypothetical protein
VERSPGDAQGGHCLDDAHVDVERVEKLAHPDAEEAAIFVASHLVKGLNITGGGLQSVFVHSE